MEIFVLGSGTGIPTKKRTAPGILVITGKDAFLLDSGSGTFFKIPHTEMDYHDINYLFYTHTHPDHINDLPEILFANAYDFLKRNRPLSIFGPKGIKSFVKKIGELYPTLSNLPFPLEIHEMEDSQIDLGGNLIISKPLAHQDIQAIGFRLESEGKALVYSGDTDFCPNIVELSKDADLLILECSFPDEHKVSGHLTPTLAGKIAAESHAKRLLLTHFYPLYEGIDIPLRVRKFYSQGELFLAEDMMRIVI